LGQCCKTFFSLSLMLRTMEKRVLNTNAEKQQSYAATDV